MLSPEGRRARAELGRAAADAKRRPNDHDACSAVAIKRRDFRFISLADHIKEVVATAPPLSATQRDSLALLLRGDVA